MKFAVKQIALVTICCSTFLLSACGGSGGGSSSGSNTSTGVFVDAPTKGLRYVSGELTGTTDVNGTFKYVAGNKVKFYVGDILLGEATGDSVITPVNLVAGAKDVSNTTVNNIVRFLLTLDDDNNPANGIEIKDAVATAAKGKTLDFTQSAENFAAFGDAQVLVSTLTTATSTGARSLTSTTTATSHVQDSIKKLMVGSYSGTISGGSTGTWTGAIDNSGVLTGTAKLSTGETMNFAGTVKLDGSGSSDFTTTGGVSNGTKFTGTFATNGNASGNWNFFTQASGTWSGKLTQAGATTTTTAAASTNSTSSTTTSSTNQTTTENTSTNNSSSNLVKVSCTGAPTGTMNASKPASESEFCQKYGFKESGQTNTCSFSGNTGTTSTSLGAMTATCTYVWQ